MLHAKHIKIGDFYNTPYPMPRLVEAFAALCAEADNYGTTIGFELMGSSMINNLKDAVTMVETAGRKNGGIILDIIQIVNLGISYAEVSRIPLQYLINIELNDGTLPGSPNHDPSRARRFCGEGEFDIQGLIHCVHNMGYQGPWAVEVMSEELTKLSLEELNTRAYKTTIAEFSINGYLAPEKGAFLFWGEIAWLAWWYGLSLSYIHAERYPLLHFRCFCENGEGD